MNDRILLTAAAGLRATATGYVAVVLASALADSGFEASGIGAVVSVGLAAAAIATLVITVLSDRFSQRMILLTLAVFSSVGALLLAMGDGTAIVLIAAAVGMLNGMGRDRGACSVIEQAILPATVDVRGRTRAFAWYSVAQDVGHATGALLAAGFQWLIVEPVGRTAIWPYAVLCVAVAVTYLFLSPAIETSESEEPKRISPRSRGILVRISVLFAVDSLGSGFLAGALVSYFFYERFAVTAAAVGMLFFFSRAANAASHLAAAWLAHRIGLVNTMVFTHIPSSLLLVTVPFAPTFPIAAGLFLLREGLVEMDVPTRQSYVMAVVAPSERATASGVTHLVRMAGWAVGPWIAGSLMQSGSLEAPLYVGAALKIGYDLALYAMFRAIKPPEEIASQ